MDKILNLFQRSEKNFKIDKEVWKRNWKQNDSNFDEIQKEKNTTLDINNNQKNKIKLVNIYDKISINLNNKDNKKRNKFLKENEYLTFVKNKNNSIFEKKTKHTVNKSINDDLILKNIIENKKIMQSKKKSNKKVNSIRNNDLKSNIFYSNKKINLKSKRLKVSIFDNNSKTNQKNNAYNKYKILDLKLIFKEKIKYFKELYFINKNNNKETNYLKQILANFKINKSNIKLDLQNLKKEYQNNNKKYKVLIDKLNKYKNYIDNLKYIKKYKNKLITYKKQNIENKIKTFYTKFKKNYNTELKEQIMRFKLSDINLKNELDHYIKQFK